MIPLICTSPGRRVEVVLPGDLDVVIRDLSGSSGMIKSEIAPVTVNTVSQSKSEIEPDFGYKFLSSRLCIEGVTVATMHPESIAWTILINGKDGMQTHSIDLTSAKALDKRDGG